MFLVLEFFFQIKSVENGRIEAKNLYGIAQIFFGFVVTFWISNKFLIFLKIISISIFMFCRKMQARTHFDFGNLVHRAGYPSDAIVLYQVCVSE